MSQKKLGSGLWLTDNPLILKQLNKLSSVRTPSKAIYILNFKIKDHKKLKTNKIMPLELFIMKIFFLIQDLFLFIHPSMFLMCTK